MSILWPLPEELRQLDKALEGLVGMNVSSVSLTVETEKDSWLTLQAWVYLQGELRLALWRNTGAVYKINDQGAVEDDPFVPAAWGTQ